MNQYVCFANNESTTKIHEQGCVLGLHVEEREKSSLEERGSVREKNLLRREHFQTREDKPDSHQ